MVKKVSIVLPTYNGARYLRESLESILAQTYPDFELIVVDGGSTDDTLRILASYPDPRLTLCHQPANSGRLPGALSLGFEQSTGEYLTWMQDDDRYDPGALENLVGYLDAHSDIDYVYSSFHWIDENGAAIKFCPVGRPDELKVRNPIGHYFMYRRKVYETIGGYDPAFFLAEDYEYWIRVFLHFRMAQIDTPLYHYRVHPGSLTIKEYGQYRALRVAADARRKWFKTGWFEHHRRIADSYIQEAFASLQNNDNDHLRQTLLLGLANNPTWIFNAGVASLFFKRILAAATPRLIRPGSE